MNKPEKIKHRASSSQLSYALFNNASHFALGLLCIQTSLLVRIGLFSGKDIHALSLHNSRSKKSGLPLQARVAQLLLILITLLSPTIGYGDTANRWFSNLVGSKGKNMKSVAIKVGALPEQHNIAVDAMDFSPDGKYLAMRSAGQTINIWDWKNARIVSSVEKASAANNGFSTERLRFSPDGRLLVACHDRAYGDVVIRVWDTATWQIVHDVIDHIGGTGCNAVGFTPDSKFLIRVLDRLPHIGGDTLIVYDTQDWQPAWGLRTVPFYTNTLAISPDGKYFALGGEIRNPKEWIFKTPVPTFGDPPLPNMALIAIVDMNNRAIVRTIQNPGVMNRNSRLAWSPDGAHLAWAGSQGLEVLEIQSGKQVAGVAPPWTSAAMSLRYTPDGKYLIEGTNSGKNTGWGKIWDGQNYRLLQEIVGDIASIAVSHDGQYLATGVDGEAIIWQLK